MRFICDTQVLCSACLQVQRAVSTKSTIPAIEGILIKALGNELILTGYDLEMGINTSVEANVQENGSVIINARVLCDILRKLPYETVSFDVDGRNMVIIKSGDIKYSLIGISADEYPELPTVSGGFPIILDLPLLKNMVRQTAFSVAIGDSSKMVYTGIKFEISKDNLKLIAVDGFRMAIRNEKIDYNGEEFSFIVPAKTLTEVIKIVEHSEEKISLGIGKRHIVFEVENYKIVSRLLDGKFLNYKANIPPTYAMSVEVDVDTFASSIDRISLILTDKNKSPVRCIFEDNYINISSNTALGYANDRIPAEIVGDRIEIGFNNRFITDALKVCDVDRVKLELTSATSPIIITPVEGDSFLFLILPVRLKADNQ